MENPSKPTKISWQTDLWLMLLSRLTFNFLVGFAFWAIPLLRVPLGYICWIAYGLLPAILLDGSLQQHPYYTLYENCPRIFWTPKRALVSFLAHLTEVSLAVYYLGIKW